MAPSQLPAAIIVRLWISYQQRAIPGGLLAGAVAGFTTSLIVDVARIGSIGRILVLIVVMLAGLTTSFFAFKAALERYDGPGLRETDATVAATRD